MPLAVSYVRVKVGYFKARQNQKGGLARGCWSQEEMAVIDSAGVGGKAGELHSRSGGACAEERGTSEPGGDRSA